MLAEDIKNKFISLFNKNPLIVRSPGRINLIGEHTDYHGGYVLPAAIDMEIICAISTNYNNKCKIIAYDLKESVEFDLSNLDQSVKGWPDYILGVIKQFKNGGMEIKGFDCVFGGNIPQGVGLSSSAAMECAFAYSFNMLFEHDLSNLEIVKLSNEAASEVEGVKCGIMDQFASVNGKANQIFRLDCKTLEYEYFNFVLEDYRVVLCDTQLKHSLASSDYIKRRNECDEGVAILQKHYSNIHSLRDVTIGQLKQHRPEMNPAIFKRCKYVVEENDRVLDCCNLLKKGDLEGFGEKMFETHDGLRWDYEVSCKELDFLQAEAKMSNMVIGARMISGRSGGCTINIVKIEYLDQFVKYMSDSCKNELNLDLKTYHVKIENGTSKL